MKQYFLPLTLGLLVAPLCGMEAEFNGKQEQEKQSPEEAAQQAANHVLGGALSRFSKPEEQKAFLATFFKKLADGSSRHFDVGSAAQLDADLNGMFTQASARYFLNNPRLPNDLLWYILTYLEPTERLYCFQCMRIALIRKASNMLEVPAAQQNRSEKLRDWYCDTKRGLEATESLRYILGLPAEELQRNISGVSIQDVKDLIDKGADVRAAFMTASNQSALVRLVSEGCLELAKALIRNGADVNATTYGKSCLHEALKQKNEGFTWLVLEHGATPNMLSVNSQHRLLRHIGVIEDAWIVPIVQELLNRGAWRNLEEKIQLVLQIKNREAYSLLSKAGVQCIV